MADLSVVAGALSALNAARQIGTAILSMKIDTDVKQQVNELVLKLGEVTGKFTEAQVSFHEAQMRIMEMEREMETLKAFETERARYVLKPIGPDTLAYVLQAGMERGDPPHKLCPRCFEERAKSILQYDGGYQGVGKVKCHRCNSELTAWVTTSRESDFPVARGVSDYNPLDD